MARKHYDRVVCADDFAMSVQAGPYNYCQPQVNEAPKYDLVAVGFPGSMEPLLMPDAETPEDPTGTVYAYDPVEPGTNGI